MGALAKFPLLAIPAILLNVLMFVGYPTSSPLAEISLPSNASLVFGWYEVILVIGLFALYLEVLKSTATGTGSVVDHALSLALFVILLLEMLLAPIGGDPAFLLLVLLCLFDVVAAFTVSIAVARRDVGFHR
ncbi:MAG: hypothetical protein KDI71_15835 [Xanthomonadales bacterium]|nr:hypothetical protein [Xanthomonadales bacterium]